jgi:nitrate/TMAO reductase-like tetraheme cytochrome c subunit
MMAAAVLSVALLGGVVFAFEVWSRPPLRAVPSTHHASLTRTSCIECHAPIADEWRQSYHLKSLTGPYWSDVRSLGYLKVFDGVRKACVNCHAPANVLDLVRTSGRPAGPLAGVECTPNLLREPAGTIPEARSDEAELGVDCTSCHVSVAGVVGSGRLTTTAHETIADARFSDPTRTIEGLCSVCHQATVDSWKQSRFASAGRTCLDCHMPAVNAPAVAGGPARLRRSHRFAADKDELMLAGAVDATLEITAGRSARFRMTNDRVGHAFPSGGNGVSVRLEARDESGHVMSTQGPVLYFRSEPLILDVWPFRNDTRLQPGDRREIRLDLPAGRGVITATVTYHDWMKVRRTIATFEARY